SVVVSPSGATIATAGGTQPFAAQFLDANGNPISGKTFTWASLNPNVATINSATGVATAVTSGQVTISATADGITGYSLLTISIPGGLPVTTWTPVASGTTQLLATVWGSSASDVFAVGNNGAIVHFNGTAWSAMTSGTSVALRGVWGSSASDVFVTGSSGTIL